MSKKQFSMENYWNSLAEKQIPEMTFDGKSQEDWNVWKIVAEPKYKELLGTFPKKVPLDAEVDYQIESNDGELMIERVVFDTEEFMSVPCIVLYPKTMRADGSNPAILCSHGHGAYGKDVVAGLTPTLNHVEAIQQANYNYAAQMARHGFLTISPDLRGFGERNDGENPFPGRDSCNINYVKGSILGLYPLTLNIWDMMCCIDYLETRPEVDKNRIGMMGLSQGGTMTTFTAALDKRIKAADIIGYVNPFAGFGMKDANFCGSQVLPEVYRYFDTHDIAGLIAPRPLLIEMGEKDTCFPIDRLKQGFANVEKIYTAAGATDKLYADIHDGGHAFSGKKAFDFFKKYL